MAINVKQFRFFDSKNSNNYNEPSNITKEGLISGSVFAPYVPIIQLGIQSLPGVQFCVNDNIDSITIGNTGIYELELDTQVSIAKLRFSSKSIEMIENSTDLGLIVDILYGREE